MQEPRKPLFTKPVEEEEPRRRRRREPGRKLRLFALGRNLLALVGLGFLVVELLRYVIIPFILVPLGSGG